MKTKVIAIILFGFFSGTSQAKNLTQTFAQCESDAYGVLGVQTDAYANSEYLEKKYELIRVCMRRNGFEFNSKGTVFLTGKEWINKELRAYESRGLASTPMNQVPQSVQKEIKEELFKERAIRLLSEKNWK